MALRRAVNGEAAPQAFMTVAPTPHRLFPPPPACPCVAEASTPPKKPIMLLAFAPERWGQVERFRRLWPSTYKFDLDDIAYVSGVEAHFHKFQVFRGLANELLPKLAKDREELDRDNFTNATEARKLAAVVEAMFGELYSMLDCTRRTLTLIYPKCTPNVDRGLGRFLGDASDDAWAPGIPPRLKDSLRDTSWFSTCLELRNQSVHSDPGNCHADKGGKISYMSSKIISEGKGAKAQVVNDILGNLDSWLDAANQTTGRVFRALNETLKDNEVQMPCGIFNFRFYERTVKPSEATTFNGGRCKSRSWFDAAPDENKCPLRDRCGAYRAAKPAAP